MTWKIFERCAKQTLAVSCMFMWIILAALAFGAVFDGLGAVRAIETAGDMPEAIRAAVRVSAVERADQLAEAGIRFLVPGMAQRRRRHHHHNSGSRWRGDHHHGSRS